MVIFLITRLHEGAVYFVDRYFNRALDAVERDLGSAMLKAKELAEIDRLLTHEPFQRLNLTSAASFRRAGHRYVRGASAEGWDGRAAATLAPDAPLLAPCAPGRPFSGSRRAGGKSAALLRRVVLWPPHLRHRPRC